jgi:hypothetical protein
LRMLLRWRNSSIIIKYLIRKGNHCQNAGFRGSFSNVGSFEKVVFQ